MPKVPRWGRHRTRLKKEDKMFAVLKTGGKQYKVASGDTLVVEKLAADAGETVQFNEILMLGGDSLQVGAPTIDGAAVQAEVVEQGKGAKTLNLKRRRRKHSSRRLKGHRQHLTTLKVTEILASGGEKTGVKAALGAASASAIAAATGETQKPAKSKEAAPKMPAASEAADTKVEAPAEETAAVETVRPSNLLDAPQGEADDLTQISGVGPKLNTKLNENGVYHFWQIREWGPAEVAFMDDQLSFKGRIDRDDWIGQATKLAEDKSK